MSGATLTIAGLVIIASLSLSGWARVAIASAWLLDCGWSLARRRRAAARLHRLRVRTGGRVDGLGPDGRQSGFDLMRGSMLAHGWAWLRLRGPDGRVHAELLLATDQSPGAWRRLAILWRLGR